MEVTCSIWETLWEILLPIIALVLGFAFARLSPPS